MGVPQLMMTSQSSQDLAISDCRTVGQYRCTTSRISGDVMVAVGALMFNYEWVHFLIHTDYKPKSAFYRKLYQGHRLHHFRNENYWYGVSRRFGDQVLGTNPSKNDVPLSPTVKALLG